MGETLRTEDLLAQRQPSILHAVGSLTEHSPATEPRRLEPWTFLPVATLLDIREDEAEFLVILRFRGENLLIAASALDAPGIRTFPLDVSVLALSDGTVSIRTLPDLRSRTSGPEQGNSP